MTKKRILLIDDEISLCQLMKLNLEQTEEYEVTTAHSGEEGLGKAQVSEFDLVITDYRMPGMDGAALLLTLKTLKPQQPVVLFSIYRNDKSKITPEIEEKADGIISKPIDYNELLKVVKNALARRRGGK